MSAIDQLRDRLRAHHLWRLMPFQPADRFALSPCNRFWQAASSGKALAKRHERVAKFEMGYGALDVFFGGLERLLGPPKMMKDPGIATYPCTRLRLPLTLIAVLCCRSFP